MYHCKTHTIHQKSVRRFGIDYSKDRCKKKNSKKVCKATVIAAAVVNWQMSANEKVWVPSRPKGRQTRKLSPLPLKSDFHCHALFFLSHLPRRKKLNSLNVAVSLLNQPLTKQTPLVLLNCYVFSTLHKTFKHFKNKK